jgi:hypothetical protein
MTAQGTQDFAHRNVVVMTAEERVRHLREDLAEWNRRDTDQTVSSYGAAARAIGRIDDVTTALAKLRDELVSEARRFDDESAARTDELLARIRQDQA